MREIGIHLENILGTVRERPLEPGNIGRAQTLFTCSLNQINAWLISHILPNKFAGPIGRTIIYYQDAKLWVGQNACEECADIVAFVIGRDYYGAIG